MEGPHGKEPHGEATDWRSDSDPPVDLTAEKDSMLSGQAGPTDDANSHSVPQHAGLVTQFGGDAPEGRRVRGGMDRSNGRLEALTPGSDVQVKPVSWMDLPKKDQLIVITLTRLSEPLVQTSLQVCLPSVLPRANPMRGQANC